MSAQHVYVPEFFGAESTEIFWLGQFEIKTWPETVGETIELPGRAPKAAALTGLAVAAASIPIARLRAERICSRENPRGSMGWVVRDRQSLELLKSCIARPRKAKLRKSAI